MKLSGRLVSQFAKVTNDRSGKVERTLYGTVVEKDGETYVRFDGSDILTPVSTTVNTLNGERVIVTIKNHTAIITGNMTSPAARNDDVQIIDDNITSSAKTATDYIRKNDDVITFGDQENEFKTDAQMCAKTFRFRIQSVGDIFKPYYEKGDTINVEWTGAGFVSDSLDTVYFSIPLAKPVIGTPNVSVSSSNGMQVRQNGSYTHNSASYAKPTYSATLTCNGGIVNIVATFSSTVNAAINTPCGITASLNIAFS